MSSTSAGPRSMNRVLAVGSGEGGREGRGVMRRCGGEVGCSEEGEVGGGEGWGMERGGKGVGWVGV